VILPLLVLPVQAIGDEKQIVCLGVGIADRVHHGRQRIDPSDAVVLSPDLERVDIENISKKVGKIR
jgi:hypothetical protein